MNESDLTELRRALSDMMAAEARVKSVLNGVDRKASMALESGASPQPPKKEHKCVECGRLYDDSKDGTSKYCYDRNLLPFVKKGDVAYCCSIKCTEKLGHLYSLACSDVAPQPREDLRVYHG